MSVKREPLHSRLRPYYSVEIRVEDVNDFDKVQDVLGLWLPANFKGFHMSLGAGCTLPPLTYVRFYPISELLERQAAVPPSVLEFATDDSSVFAFDTTSGKRDATYPVVSYPLSSIHRAELQLEADHFDQLLERLLLRLEPLRPL